MKENAIGHLVKTNPIKPNFKRDQMNVNLLITKDSRKNDDFVVRINKPNFRKSQMNANLTLTKDYRKNDCLAAQKTNPIQTQSCPP